tara:strand:+ start:1155 stop:2084 length:930 start_codon:yes stop_codon:yes gene_type:complete
MINSSITIVIPVYNVKKFLNETLLSVKNQLSQPDEVVIIDDGSTDGSSKLLENFNKLRHWKIIRTPNNGLGLTRNYGRSIAQSEYIYFLDADDIIKNNLILKIREIINNYNKPDMILFSGETFSERKLSIKKTNLKLTINGKFNQKSNLISQLIKKKEALPQAGRYITKNSLWTENKLKYPPIIFEDEAVFLPLLALSKNTVVLSNVYFFYRKDRRGSLTNSLFTNKHALSYFHVINSLINFMTANPDLIEKDISAWRYRVGRNGLNYVSMCIKTKSPIDWRIIYKITVKIKSISFVFKLIWRIIKTLS